MSNSPKQPGRKKSTTTGSDILIALADFGASATTSDLSAKLDRTVTHRTLDYLAKQHKVVRNTGKFRRLTDGDGNPQRGRPAALWALTSTGRSRVKRLQAAATDEPAAA